MRDIVVFSGSSHPQLAQDIATKLDIPLGNVKLGKFSNNETLVQVLESVRDMDCYIVQSSCHSQQQQSGSNDNQQQSADMAQAGKGMTLNDHLMELLIMISACKMASARKVIAVIPSFFYARQPDVPYKPSGQARRPEQQVNSSGSAQVMLTPSAKQQLNAQKEKQSRKMKEIQGDSTVGQGLSELQLSATQPQASIPQRLHMDRIALSTAMQQDGTRKTIVSSPMQPSVSSLGLVKSGYRHWAARSGTLIAHMLMAAGTDHIITMDLHDPQFQGFFDIPVDNLYSAPLMIKYIRENIANYKQAVIISPDAGGAKRATTIAHKLGTKFALIHKERKVLVGPNNGDNNNNSGSMFNAGSSNNEANPSLEEHGMMLVGNVSGQCCILIDDIADTSTTITKAAALLKQNGASRIIALISHGVLSGDAPFRVKQSHIDEIILSNSVPQERNIKVLGMLPDKRSKQQQLLSQSYVKGQESAAVQQPKQQSGKMGVFDVSGLFAEAIRRIHHGESIQNFIYAPVASD